MAAGTEPLRPAKLVGHFLQTRRSRLRPADVGMAPGGRRRTPGLRREEVAVLAGLSVSWYTWLEQGRDINVSPTALHAISRALRLDPCERRYLFRLLGLRSGVGGDGTPHDEQGGIEHLVAGWTLHPAFVRDRYWDVVAANEAAIDLLGLAPGRQNLLVDAFCLEGSTDRYPASADVRRRYAARLRDDLSLQPQDARLASLVCHLSRRSEHFTRLWELHEILDGTASARVRVARDGRRSTFTSHTLAVGQRGYHRLALLRREHE